MQCPACQSDNTQKLSLVYEQGTQNIRTTGRTYGGGGGIGRGGLGGGFGSATTTTTGKQQTIAAQKAAPPDKKKIILPIIIIAVGIFLFFQMFPLGLLVTAGGGFLFWKFYRYNSDTFPPLYAQWEKSWVCNKCGTVFTPQTNLQ